ncbi:MAG: hypothetical protein WA133_11535, partial [Syntrophales bacterium]
MTKFKGLNSALREPGEIGFLPLEIPLNSIDKDGIGFQRPEAAGLSQGEYPFYPPIAFVAAGSLTA